MVKTHKSVGALLRVDPQEFFMLKVVYAQPLAISPLPHRWLQQ